MPCRRARSECSRGRPAMCDSAIVPPGVSGGDAGLREDSACSIASTLREDSSSSTIALPPQDGGELARAQAHTCWSRPTAGPAAAASPSTCHLSSTGAGRRPSSPSPSAAAASTSADRAPGALGTCRDVLSATGPTCTSAADTHGDRLGQKMPARARTSVSDKKGEVFCDQVEAMRSTLLCLEHHGAQQS